MWRKWIFGTLLFLALLATGELLLSTLTDAPPRPAVTSGDTLAVLVPAPGVPAPDAMALEAARQVLTARSVSLNLVGAQVTLQAGPRLVVSGPPVADRARMIAALLAPGVVTAVDLGTQPAPVDAPVPPDAAARPVLSAADFDPTKVLLHVDAQTQAAQVDVVLTPTGAQRLAAYTTAHVGSYLGFVLDGRLVAAPRVAAPIAGGSLEIALPNAEAAQRLALALHSGPLPFALAVAGP